MIVIPAGTSSCHTDKHSTIVIPTERSDQGSQDLSHAFEMTNWKLGTGNKRLKTVILSEAEGSIDSLSTLL